MELTDVLHAGTGLYKLKVASKFWDGHGQKWVWPVWWLTVSKEWTDGITHFLYIDTDSQKLKADQNFFGCAWSKMSVLSLVMRL